jgi:hypothetical protein
MQKPLGRCRCCCGSLRRAADGHGTVVVREQGTGIFSLRLTPTARITAAFCVTCGGHQDWMNPENATPCNCSFLEKAAKAYPRVIAFDDFGSGQFHLHGGGPRREVYWIYFCPNCGGSAIPCQGDSYGRGFGR